MSLINTAVDSAIAIAERRRGKLGAALYSGRPQAVLMRNIYALKSSTWLVVLSGFVEPVFYLLAFGVGLGRIIGNVTDGSGNPISYAMFIAPALLATSAMNGAIYDSTWNVFFKMHFGKIYQAMLSTSLGPLDVALGEIGWALLRGFVYACGFMIVVGSMGLIPSVWGLLAIPAAVLIAFGFASVGMGITSYLKNFHQMDWINFFMLPMFLFSGTFYPLTVYPDWLRMIIESFPLYQAIALVRGCTLGNIDASLLGHALYFVVMIVLGLLFTTKRLRALFLK
ncbi:MAG: ABC transporter permease [Microbacteriaceae bacterium]